MTYHLIRYRRSLAPELVAVVHDLAMALAWTANRRLGEYRRFMLAPLDETR